MTESISAKVAYVRGQGQTREHYCHWHGCAQQVPPSAWGCRGHWYALPADLRNRVWATYRPGQERTLTPSPQYLQVAAEVQAWIVAHEALRARPGGTAATAPDAQPNLFTNLVGAGDGAR